MFYFSLTWCLERKIPVGKKPVSLSSVPMTGGVRRSFSGDEELTPPQYRTLPAQTAPEACQPPRTSREFSPSLKTGNWSCKKTTTLINGGQNWLRIKHGQAWNMLTHCRPHFSFKNRKNIHFLQYLHQPISPSHWINHKCWVPVFSCCFRTQQISSKWTKWKCFQCTYWNKVN